MIKEIEPSSKTHLKIPVLQIAQFLNRQGRQGTPSFPFAVLSADTPKCYFARRSGLGGYFYLGYEMFRSVIKEAEPSLKINLQIPVQCITLLLNRQERQETPREVYICRSCSKN